MRVLMTGATGLIGREVGKVLAARGDTLVCLVRDVQGARRRLPFPAECYPWDHTRHVPPQALSGVDAVIHLAGDPVADTRWTPAKKARVRDSRVDGTRHLVDAVIAHAPGLKAFVHGSAIGYWGDRGDEVLSAHSARGRGFLADVVDAWEAELAPLVQKRPEVRVPVVRTGVVLARQGGALTEMLPMFRLSVAGALGSGRQWMAWIHIDDIVGLLVHALDVAPSGVLEGVGPTPATNRQFTRALCGALGVMMNAPAPRPMIQLMFGERADVVLASNRVAPSATLASGYRFRFETVEAALSDLLSPLRGNTWEKTWEQWVPRTPDALWPFFREARNLEELTPAFLKFNVVGQSTDEIGEGTLIDYRLRLEGFPIRWRSRISAWAPVARFVDEQVQGPYALWHHTHDFVPVAGGTLMRDTVRWRLPVGWLGAAVAGWKVAATVDRIFDYRSAKIDERFGSRG